MAGLSKVILVKICGKNLQLEVEKTLCNINSSTFFLITQNNVLRNIIIELNTKLLSSIYCIDVQYTITVNILFSSRSIAALSVECRAYVTVVVIDD